MKLNKTYKVGIHHSKTCRPHDNSFKWIPMFILFIIMITSVFAKYESITKIQVECTGSMYPTLNCTNTIYIKYSDDIRLNDIIVFKNPDNITVLSNGITTEYEVIHRIVKVNLTGYVTKGDFNNITDLEANDWFVPKDKVLGKVYKIE